MQRFCSYYFIQNNAYIDQVTKKGILGTVSGPTKTKIKLFLDPSTDVSPSTKPPIDGLSHDVAIAILLRAFQLTIVKYLR